MRYVKKFNNNVALVQDQDNHDWIVIGRGISFGKEPGDKVTTSEIERRFLAEPSQSFSYIVQTIFSLTPEVIEAVNEMIEEAEKNMNVRLKEVNYITLLDHIHFALKRSVDGLEYSAPLRWETKKLYPKEYQAAIQSVAFLNQKLGVDLPDSEITFFTMHYVNTVEEKTTINQGQRIEIITSRILAFISQEYQIELDAESTDYIRFLTHLRYFVIRQINQEALKDTSLDRDLLMMIREKYQRAYQVALGISEKVRREEGWEITYNEIVYLTIHVWRITSEENN